MKQWQRGLIRDLKSGFLAQMPQGRDPQRIVNDAIAWVRGSYRMDAALFNVLISLRPDGRWIYELYYDGVPYNVIARYVEGR